MKMLTATQLAEWEAYDRIEPIGQYRTDIMLGTLCSLVKDSLSSIFRKRGSRVKPTNPWTWNDWMAREHERYTENLDRQKGAVAIVKERFGIVE